MRRRFILLAALVLCGCPASDAPKTAPVRGTVTMQGQPLPRVGVTFLPLGKGPIATGNTNEQGEFTLRTVKPADGAAIGGHKVVVGRAEEGPLKPGSAVVPKKYGSPETTTLTAEVKSGQANVFAFELAP